MKITTEDILNSRTVNNSFTGAQERMVMEALGVKFLKKGWPVQLCKLDLSRNWLVDFKQKANVYASKGGKRKAKAKARGRFETDSDPIETTNVVFKLEKKILVLEREIEILRDELESRAMFS